MGAVLWIIGIKQFSSLLNLPIRLHSEVCVQPVVGGLGDQVDGVGIGVNLTMAVPVTAFPRAASRAGCILPVSSQHAQKYFRAGLDTVHPMPYLVWHEDDDAH